MNINRVTLLGRLTHDPEVRKTTSGKDVAGFALATNRSWKDGDEWKSLVDYHNIVAWQELAEKVMAFAKGDLVFVEGRIQHRKWQGKDGVNRTRSEIVADKVSLLEARASRARAAEAQA